MPGGQVVQVLLLEIVPRGQTNNILVGWEHVNGRRVTRRKVMMFRWNLILIAIAGAAMDIEILFEQLADG